MGSKRHTAGTTQASLIGACAPRPVAVCDVTPDEIEPHSDAATWIGEDSYDQQEHQL